MPHAHRRPPNALPSARGRASAGQFEGQGDHHTPKPYVRQTFRKYLECGIFARARCNDCGHDYFVAYSRKGRGVCSSCNTRRMVETAAHLTDHVSSPPPAGAPGGVVCAQTAAVLYAARRGGTEHGAAYFSASHCANASCAPSSLRACWRTLAPNTCWPTSTAVSRWMLGCALRHTTALHKSKMLGDQNPVPYLPSCGQISYSLMARLRSTC